MQLGFRTQTGSELAGIFVLSSYACDDSPMWDVLKANATRRRPPLFQRHGAADHYILPAWGTATAKRLHVEGGVEVDFGLVEGLSHELAKTEMDQLMEWLLRVLCMPRASKESIVSTRVCKAS